MGKVPPGNQPFHRGILEQVGLPCWFAVDSPANRPQEVDSTVIHWGIIHLTGDPTPHRETYPTGDFSQ